MACKGLGNYQAMYYYIPFTEMPWVTNNYESPHNTPFPA